MSTPFDTPAGSTNAVVPATLGQINYIASMLAERDMASQPDKYIARAAAVRMAIRWVTGADSRPTRVTDLLAGITDVGHQVNALLTEVGRPLMEPEDAYLWAPMTRSSASTMIDWLTTLPRKDRVERAAKTISTLNQWTEHEHAADVVDTHTCPVPAGRYAVKTNDGAINELAFYKVDRPTEGKWAGYVFVKHIVGGDEIRLSRMAGAAVLMKIETAGVAESSAAYGHEIGECGVCGRQLTNDDSRARGIGPKCASKNGW